MADEEQERFEDYIELENYISELQAGHISHPPAGLTPEQLRVYQMAALLRSLAPDAAEPRPQFTADLEARLFTNNAGSDGSPLSTLSSPEHNTLSHQSFQEQPTIPSPALKQEDNRASIASSVPPAAPRQLIKRISRRSLLTGGAVAAASLAVGTGTGAAIDHLVEQQHAQTSSGDTSNATSKAEVAITSTIPTIWLLVTTLKALDTAAVRFSTESVIGYVLRVSASRQDTSTIIAVSAACTHKGCIVQWHNNDRLFHCPCHEGLFDASGTFVNIAQYGYTLAPLPRFNVKIEQDKVYVEVPAPHTSSSPSYPYS